MAERKDILVRQSLHSPARSDRPDSDAVRNVKPSLHVFRRLLPYLHPYRWKIAMAVVLIVEDDVFILALAEMMIEDWDHHILSAGDVDGALLLLRSHQHIDVLFTDIYLQAAVLGGCEIADEAMRLRPQLAVLYTTGSSVTEKMKALFVEGAHFLQKPYTEHQLHESVDSLLAA